MQMSQPQKTVFDVEQEHQQHRTGPHKRVPRWFRMSLRSAVTVGLIAIPALAIKDPAFDSLVKYKPFGIVFAVLGGFVLPMWIPCVGDVVLTFTLVIPLAYAGLWLAFGLFQACSSIIFMMLACVVVTALTFFLAQLLGLPVGLLSIFPTVFVVGANSFVQNPRLALLMSKLLTVLLVVAAILAITVSALVFPEYNVDEVFRHHHEGLEHLLHLAYYVMGLRPPRLAKRVASSAAMTFGKGSKWSAAFAAADELPTHLQALDAGRFPSSLAPDASQDVDQEAVESAGGAAAAAAGSSMSSFAQAAKVERSWHRVAVAFEAGAKALVGSKAEVVLMAAHHKRIIIPCSPLIPCAKGQIDEPGLLALRHTGMAAALQLIKIYNALQPSDVAGGQLLQGLMSAQEWSSMRSSLLAALQELVVVFPMDYYPVAESLNRDHLQAAQKSLKSLQTAWQRVMLSKSSQQQQQQQQVVNASSAPHHVSNDLSIGQHVEESHAVTVLPGQAAAAAAAGGGGLDEQLVQANSAGAAALARLNVAHILKLLQDQVDVLEQLYDLVQEVSERLISCKCC